METTGPKRTLKTCKDCGKDLPLENYHYSDKKRNILKSYCKDCSYERAQAHIAKDPLAYRSYMERYYKENKEKFPGNHISSLPREAGVYLINHLLTDNSYIGCSSNLRNRLYKHRRGVGASKNRELTKLIKEYGFETFEILILEKCSRENMFEVETKWIHELQPNLNKNKK